MDDLDRLDAASARLERGDTVIIFGSIAVVLGLALFGLASLIYLAAKVL